MIIIDKCTVLLLCDTNVSFVNMFLIVLKYFLHNFIEDHAKIEYTRIF